LSRPRGGGSGFSIGAWPLGCAQLVGAETGNNIILFDETAPAGIEMKFYRHRDSD
jgi:hypothetical protein